MNIESEVFSSLGLYVVDASILPTSTGPNPSLTIDAIRNELLISFQINVIRILMTQHSRMKKVTPSRRPLLILTKILGYYGYYCYNSSLAFFIWETLM